MTLAQMREWASEQYNLAVRANVNTLCDALEAALEVIHAKHPVEAERLAELAKITAPSDVWVVWSGTRDPLLQESSEFDGDEIEEPEVHSVHLSREEAVKAADKIAEERANQAGEGAFWVLVESRQVIR